MDHTRPAMAGAREGGHKYPDGYPETSFRRDLEAMFEHDPIVQVGEPLRADPWVVIGERSGRPGVDHAGSLGPHAHLRRGTILYAGSTIGAHFETGHFVVIREQCTI